MAIEDDIQQKKFTSEYQKMVINILYTSSWLNERQSTVFKDFGLTAPQYNVLRILRGQHPKPSTINLIIERMLDRMSNASRIVDKLEKKNLVVRKQCPSDRRAVDVIISEKGLELLQRMDPVLNNWEKELDILTVEEAATLNSLLDKVRQSSLFEDAEVGSEQAHEIEAGR